MTSPHSLLLWVFFPIPLQFSLSHKVILLLFLIASSTVQRAGRKFKGTMNQQGSRKGIKNQGDSGEIPIKGGQEIEAVPSGPEKCIC